MRHNLSFDIDTLTYRDTVNEHLNSFGKPVTTETILGDISYALACELPTGEFIYKHTYQIFPGTLLSLYLLCDKSNTQLGCAAAITTKPNHICKAQDRIISLYSIHAFDHMFVDGLTGDFMECYKKLSAEEQSSGVTVLCRLCVNPDYRQTGLGGSLLDTTILHSLELGSQLILLDPMSYVSFGHPKFDFLIYEVRGKTTSLSNFYHSHGFSDYNKAYGSPLVIKSNTAKSMLSAKEISVKYSEGKRINARLNVRLTEQEIEDLLYY